MAEALPPCPLCGSAEVVARDGRAADCPRCGLLINRQTTALDYSQGGGQAIPDPGKMKWRIENARLRFRIIRQFLAGHELFVDIGCGSGEMLEVSRCCFPHHIGFDTNQPLIEYVRGGRGLNAVAAPFDARLLDPSWRGLPKVVALSHVLEHLAAPMELLSQVDAFLRPGDLLYLEVPLHTGRSLARLGYRWSLWNAEHVALYSMKSLVFIGERLRFAVLHRGYRIFARGSKSGKTLVRLFLANPAEFVRQALTKPSCHTMADVMIRDYGCVVLRKQ